MLVLAAIGVFLENIAGGVHPERGIPDSSGEKAFVLEVIVLYIVATIILECGKTVTFRRLS